MTPVHKIIENFFLLVFVPITAVSYDKFYAKLRKTFKKTVITSTPKKTMTVSFHCQGNVRNFFF